MNDEVIIPVELEAKDDNVKATLDKIRKYMEDLEKRRATLIDARNLAVTKSDISAIDKAMEHTNSLVKEMQAHYGQINEYLKATEKYETRTYEKARLDSLQKEEALTQRLIESHAKLAQAKETVQKADKAYERARTAYIEKESSTLSSIAGKQGSYTSARKKALKELADIERQITQSEQRQTALENERQKATQHRLATGNTTLSEREKLLRQQADAERTTQKNLKMEQAELKRTINMQEQAIQRQKDRYAQVLHVAELAAQVARSEVKGVAEADQRVNSLQQEIETDTARLHVAKLNTAEIERQISAGAKLTDVYDRVYHSEEAMRAGTKRYKEDFDAVTKGAVDVVNAHEKSAQATNQLVRYTTELHRRYDGIIGKLRKMYDISNERILAERQAIATLKEQGKSIDKTATNIYKATRASKMLEHELDRILGNIKKMQSAFSTGFKGFLKTILALGTGFMSLAVGISKTHKAQKGLNREFGFGFKTLLKYGLGIRSLYVLFNRLRSGVVDALKALALASDYVNEEISSLVTSLRFMQAAMATVVQPILKVLAPALEVLSAAFEKAAYYVSSFIATLTGQDFVFRAIRDQVDYAESLDKTAKAAKKARKELGYYDKLNVIHKDSKNGGGSGLADQMAGYKYATSPLNEAARQFAEKVKKIMKNLFRPFRKSWNSTGQVVMDKWKKALESVKVLVTDIGQTFLDVWNQDETVAIFENILSILGSIGGIVDKLATKFKEAWDKNDIGKKILERVRDMFGEIAVMVKYLVEETEKWSQNIDFTNMLNSLYSLLGKLDKGPLQHIISIVEHFWTAVVLPFMTYMIEEGLPLLMDTLGRISDAIEWDKFEQNMNKLSDAIGKFLPKAWKALNIILEDFGKIVADIINSDGFAKLIDLFKNWVENTDPKEMAKDIEQVAIALVSLKVAFLGLKAITGAIITFGSFATALTNIKALLIGEKSIVVAGETVVKASFWDKLVKRVGDVVKAFGSIGTSTGKVVTVVTEDMGTVTSAVGDGMTEITASVSGTEGAFTSMASALSGGLLTFAGAVTNILGFLTQLDGEITAAEVIVTALGAAIGAVGLVVAGFPALVAGSIAAVLFAIEEFIAAIATAPEKVAEAFSNIPGMLSEVKVNILTWVSDTFYNVGDKIGQGLGKILRRIVNFFTNIGGKISDWWEQELPKINKGLQELPKNIAIFIKETDWAAFGKSIIEGIVFIFTSPIQILTIIGQAIASLVGGFFDGIKKGFEINSPSKVMIPIGKYIIQGILKGITDSIKNIGSWIKTNIVDKFITGVKTGFENIASGLKDIGKNIVEGIKGGVEENLSKVNDAGNKVAETIKNKVEERLQIQSPSRVFRQIGLYIDEGLAEGIDDGTKDATKAASNTADEVAKAADTQFDIDSVADFSDKFLGILASMSDQAVSIISAMIDSIDERLAHLTMVDSLAALNNSLSKVAMTDIPKISKGFTIPAAVAVKNAKEKDSTSEFDWNRLSDIIRDAVDEAVSNRSLDSNDPVVLMLNGKQIAKAVWDEDAKRYKQTGKEGYSY